MTNSLNNSNYKFPDKKKDEINISHVINIILRNKLLISSIGLISFLITFIFSLSLKRLWQGEFQIVLKTDESSSALSSNNATIRKLAKLQGKLNSLNTEVGILRSASLLMPIYEFYETNNQKIKNGKDTLSFRNWKKNLSIELEKGTTILNISYRDNFKNQIIPVLEKMSNSYQDYSGSEKKRTLSNTNRYLKNQIEAFKIKSRNSIKAAQEFAIDQDLTMQGSEYKDTNQLNRFSTSETGNLLNNQLSGFSFLPNVSIEGARVRSANEIRKIESQIDKINAMGDDLEGIKFIAYSIESLKVDNITDRLSEIEEEIVLLKSLYKDESNRVKRAVEKREIIKNLLKKRIIGYLEAQKLVETSRMNATLRPKEVLIKYKELVREAQSDEITLISLENELRFNELESQKRSDPWQLVTNPTLLDYPVSPNRKRIALMGLVGGLLVGCFYSSYKERKIGLIYDTEILEESFSVPILESFTSIEIKTKSRNIELIKDLIFSQSNKYTTLIVIGEMKQSDLDCLNEFLLQINDSDNRVNLVYQNFEMDEKFKSNSKILITSLGFVKYEEINSLKKRFDFIGSKLDGILVYKK